MWQPVCAVAGNQGSTEIEAHPISIVAPAMPKGMQEFLNPLHRDILILTRNGEKMDPKTKMFQSSKGSYMLIKIQRLPHPRKVADCGGLPSLSGAVASEVGFYLA